ncbi:hypothetical protein AB6H27_22690 [Providencia huaxiensis]|uniref:hypothetical protein n=1 Tax=Providencia TaxID=586 RepID=UPI0018C72EF9|nr:hypothetical protein [Providencia stuartii]MBG5918983.1 hypothetical protein [Providencia stuartii]
MFGESAAVQYDDWKGTIALDRNDQKSITYWARNQNIINDNDNIFGFDIWFSEISKTFTIKFKTSVSSYDEIKKSQNPESCFIDKETTLEPHQFIELLANHFKRINIIASVKGFE